MQLAKIFFSFTNDPFPLYLGTLAPSWPDGTHLALTPTCMQMQSKHVPGVRGEHADCALKELKALMMYSRNWACSRQYHTTPARCSPRHGEFATHAIVTRCRPSCIGFFVVDQARLGGAVRPCRDEFGVWSVIRAPIPWPRGKQLAESSSMQMPCWPVRAFVSSRRGRRRPGYETERRAGWAGHRKK